MQRGLIILTLSLVIINVVIFLNFCEDVPSKVKQQVQNFPKKEDQNQDELIYYTESTQKIVSEKLDAILNKESKYRGFNGSVLVSKNDSILFTGYYGMANFKEKKQIDSSSVFQLASVSKQFTATAIMMLYERGQLRLDDKVTKYFPDFPYKYVTIEQLLNHTSGLPSYFYLAEKKWNGVSLPENEDIMDLFEQHKPYRYFRPGRSFKYSNSGYIVLASIIEKVTGGTLNNFMQKNIFKPLNMNNTFVFRASRDSVSNNQLLGYRGAGWRKRKVIDPYWEDAITGDKNVYSNTIDLYKWMKGLNAGKIVSDSTLSKMYSMSHTSRGRKIPYGYGFRIKSDKNKEKVVYHNGKWNGFRTSLKQYLKDDIRVLVLEHTNYPSVSNLADRVKNEVVKVLN